MQRQETSTFSKQKIVFPNIFIHKLSKTEFQNMECELPNDIDEISFLSDSEFGNNFNMNDEYYIEHPESLNFFPYEKSTKSGFNSAFTYTFSYKSNSDEKEEDENEVHLIKKKSEEIEETSANKSTNHLLNKKTETNQKDLFYVDNGNDKFGNTLKDISGRKDNLRSKIKRHFIQNIVYKWITNKEPEKKDKLKSKQIQDFIKSFNNHKTKKLSEIYNIPNYKNDEIIKIKLNFTLEQVFKCFSNPIEERTRILSSILEKFQPSINIDEEAFFAGLNKQKYFNWLIKNGSALNKVNQVFEKISMEFSDSELF